MSETQLTLIEDKVRSLMPKIYEITEKHGEHHAGWFWRRGPLGLKAAYETLKGLYESCFGERRFYHTRKHHWRTPPGWWLFYKELGVNILCGCDSETSVCDYEVYIGNRLAFRYYTYTYFGALLTKGIAEGDGFGPNRTNLELTERAVELMEDTIKHFEAKDVENNES